ncbi:putative serine protease K12H4.7 [Anopheles aquasalis]|uniref:putative serine protease K12H4.7 n=1 Tax=Anopheles aquasalis TaxID=42839 RepID=UPI00215AA039|nr:putative serine protease K12H4.7 [Anopheles aquasalis]
MVASGVFWRVAVLASVCFALVAGESHLRLPFVLDSHLHPHSDYVANRSEALRFRTRVDHYDVQNRDTFEFDYLSNDEFYQPGGPIFIVVGGNSAINGYFIENGLFHDIARSEGAWLFANEHRYYGRSAPVENYSATNMRFLSVEQSLVDLIEWIDYLRQEVVRDPNARVVLHGLGYGGAVAIWARQRFPQLIDGAWGSVASVIARVNFNEYGEDMGNTVRHLGSDACFGILWRGFRTAENLIDAGLYGRVSELFRTCEPLTANDPLTVETFFYGLKSSIEQEMYGEANPQSVTRMCQELEADTAGTDLEVLANFFERRYAPFECVPFDFESNIASALYEGVGAPTNAELGIRQRLYQLCTEFGWFLTSATGDSPFGTRITYRYFIDTCRAVFGDWIDQEVVYDGVRLTNLHFGADDPRVTNVVYVNAELDPTRLVSITDYINVQSNAFVIQGELIALDWLPQSPADSDDLSRIKSEISAYVRGWSRGGLTD